MGVCLTACEIDRKRIIGMTPVEASNARYFDYYPHMREITKMEIADNGRIYVRIGREGFVVYE
jgi:hypothetical protein